MSLLLTPHYLNHVEREHAQVCSTMRRPINVDQIMRAAAGDPSRKAEAARAEVQPRLRRSHLPCRSDREFQHLAKGAQICIPWSDVIRFPKIDACRADTDLLSDFGNR